jgi:3-hydroxyisobutyrate dehydrogenase-like beta-hydroxyacid dehydrogenase
MSSHIQHAPGRTDRRIGVVGLGRMGDAFSANLLEGGYEVRVFDRNREPAMALGSAGARVAGSLADLAGCNLVITSLPNDEALTSVTLGAGGLIGGLARNAIHVSMSTGRR